MSKRALVILADGFEEVEATTPIDLLRRAAIDVTVAGLGATAIRGAHDINCQADAALDSVTGEFDADGLGGHELTLTRSRSAGVTVITRAKPVCCRTYSRLAASVGLAWSRISTRARSAADQSA